MISKLEGLRDTNDQPIYLNDMVLQDHWFILIM